MARAYASFPRTVVLVIVLFAGGGVAAGGGAGTGGARKTSNSFMLVQGAPPQVSGATPASAGTGIPSSKPIILNPYHVPLLQNASSLRSSR